MGISVQISLFISQVIIFFTDHKISLKHEKDLVANQVETMKNIKLVPVAIGTHVIIRELQKIANDGQDIIHFGEYEEPETVSKRIWHGTEMHSCISVGGDGMFFM